MLASYILLCFVLFLIYKMFLSGKRSDFWKQFGIQQIQTSTLLDKLLLIGGKKSIGDFDEIAYKEMERTGSKFIGTIEMGQPLLIVKDLEIVKNIIIRDFEYFVDRRTVFKSDSQEIMSNVIANLHGEKWKGVRSQMSPAFSTGKIRRLMEHFNTVGLDWVKRFEENSAKTGTGLLAIKARKEVTAYLVDVFTSAVFGSNADTIRNPDSYFAKMIHKLTYLTLGVVIRIGLSFYFPKLWNMLRLYVLDQEALEFFSQLISEGMAARLEGRLKTNDFLQLLVEAKKFEVKALGPDELSEFEKDAKLDSSHGRKNYFADDVIAKSQALAFFLAGFFTANSVISFVMYLLALNPDVQKKLREEVSSQLFSHGRKEIDYDELNGLQYLDMVVSETLRKYGPADRFDRICTKEYFDPSNNLRVPKGAVVIIPLRSIHNDKLYYEHPDKFYPEHFSPELKAKRNSYGFLAFGGGARSCIGMRLGLITIKAVVAHLVHRFVVEPSPTTPIPVKVEPFAIAVHVPKDLELILRPIESST